MAGFQNVVTIRRDNSGQMFVILNISMDLSRNGDSNISTGFWRHHF